MTKRKTCKRGLTFVAGIDPNGSVVKKVEPSTLRKEAHENEKRSERVNGYAKFVVGRNVERAMMFGVLLKKMNY